MCAAGAARQEKAREKERQRKGSQRNGDAILPLETLPGHIDCRVLSLGARVQ
jgi:hypothetical protein